MIKLDKHYEKIVGKNIKRFREEKSMTQEQLAIKMQTLGCDTTRSSLAKMEVGQRHIYCDELRLIKTILNVSYEDLLT